MARRGACAPAHVPGPAAQLTRPSARLFHAISVKDYNWEPEIGDRGIEWYVASAERFLERLGGHADPRGKTVLDVGTGSGELSAILGGMGATRVVGVDLELPADVHERLRERFGAESLERVELIQTSGDLHELDDEQFDLVISKEAMEHYDDPESFVTQIVRFIKPGGVLAIGFGPLWKSFDGAHMGFMTRVPWAHLMFPEDVIMAERRRFRPDEPATHFGDPRWSEQDDARPFRGDHGEHRSRARLRQATIRPSRRWTGSRGYGLCASTSPTTSTASGAGRSSARSDRQRR